MIRFNPLLNDPPSDRLPESEEVISRSPVADANRVVRELAASNPMGPQIVLGNPTQQTRQGADQIVQAALIVPLGVGICRWDVEEFRALDNSAEGPEAEAASRFQSFDQCDPDEKSFLLSNLEELLEDFVDANRALSARLHRDGATPAREYFATRNALRNPSP